MSAVGSVVLRDACGDIIVNGYCTNDDTGATLQGYLVLTEFEYHSPLAYTSL